MPEKTPPSLSRRVARVVGLALLFASLRQNIERRCYLQHALHLLAASGGELLADVPPERLLRGLSRLKVLPVQHVRCISVTSALH